VTKHSIIPFFDFGLHISTIISLVESENQLLENEINRLKLRPQTETADDMTKYSIIPSCSPHFANTKVEAETSSHSSVKLIDHKFFSEARNENQKYAITNQGRRIDQKSCNRPNKIEENLSPHFLKTVSMKPKCILD
jgi:hypothetical protein